MRVLVTGGAGFIGSNLVHSLVASGHAPGVIDDLSTGSISNMHPAAWSRVMDIRDDRLAAAVAEFAPEAIVHLAAQSDVGRAIADPDLDWSVNVEGTRAVCRAGLEAGVTRLIAASSAAVYGEPETIPTPELATKAPQNPYGRSKLAMEEVLREELMPAGVDIAALRFSNVYGPRQSSRAEGGVIAIFSDLMSARVTPTVYGTGAQTRDFVYVGDVIAAILAALACDRIAVGEGADEPAYNVATGIQTSINELIGLMRIPTGYMGGVVHADAKPGDPARSALDPSKAERSFGWTAQTPLETGLAHTVAWFKDVREDRESV